jgi:pimeloyl-ACP methyl ester carboxylesterase
MHVLVHGAWSGAHGFRRVRALLHEGGHLASTPSLTGIGERAHLTGPEVNLTTHVHDVVNHILYEDLHDIVLLGFSYGGFVVTGALEHIATRVRHLVFLDAFVPRADGDTVWSALGRPTSGPLDVGADWLVAPAPRAFDDPDEAAFMNPRRTPQPIRCFTDPVRMSRPLEDHDFTRTYIRATGDSPDAPGAAVFDAAATVARASPAWQYREIRTNHMIASNRPAELAALLLELTASSPL